MYIRGNREDYDGWEAAGNPGWGFEDVLPFFLKSEDNMQIGEVDGTYHRTGGILPVSKFPYHPPLSYAILRAGQELGECIFVDTVLCAACVITGCISI